MPVKAVASIYQLKVTLVETKPPIWRRIVVPSDIRLGELHVVLQVVMGWSNYYPHQFVFGGVRYGLQDDFCVQGEVENENIYKLNQLLKSEHETMTYEYDFTDSWQHAVVLQTVLPDDEEQTIPRCIDGQRACPPERCGGVSGYQDILDALKDQQDPEYEKIVEVVGRAFNPEGFDVDEVNSELSGYLGSQSR